MPGNWVAGHFLNSFVKCWAEKRCLRQTVRDSDSLSLYWESNGRMAQWHCQKSKSFVFEAFWLNMTIPNTPHSFLLSAGACSGKVLSFNLGAKGWSCRLYTCMIYADVYIYICHTCIQTSKHISWHLCIYTSLPIFGPLLSIAIMLFQTFLLSVLVVRIDSLLLRRTCVAAGSAGHWF